MSEFESMQPITPLDLRRFAEAIFRAAEARRLLGKSINEQHLIGVYNNPEVLPGTGQIHAITIMEKQVAAMTHEGAKNGVKRSIREQRRKVLTMEKGAKPLLDPIFQPEEGKQTETIQLGPEDALEE